ncbi:MAG: VOC family protein [Candidatus Heimdallarchaeota archaeon]
MILGIDVSFIHVKDPEMMAKWYEEKLGLKILHKRSLHQQDLP